MRDSTPALKVLLASGQVVRCNLYTLTMHTGQTYRWTDGDVDVVAASRVFSSSGPSISGARIKNGRGLQVDSMDLQVLATAADLIAGVTWQTAARSGALDGVQLIIEKGFMSDWSQPAETLMFFAGEISVAAAIENGATLTVVSDADKLNTEIPRLKYQPGCVRTLYRCGVTRAAFVVNASVLEATDKVAFSTTLNRPDNYFSLGDIVFISGLNAGVRRSVKSYQHENGKVSLSFPLVYPIQQGDAFMIYPGCDKTRGANGCAKFNNDINFKGTPYVPKPEAVV